MGETWVGTLQEPLGLGTAQQADPMLSQLLESWLQEALVPALAHPHKTQTDKQNQALPREAMVSISGLQSALSQDLRKDCVQMKCGGIPRLLQGRCPSSSRSPHPGGTLRGAEALDVPLPPSFLEFSREGLHCLTQPQGGSSQGAAMHCVSVVDPSAPKLTERSGRCPPLQLSPS